MNRPRLTACLLAGGKSSRMGRDKAGVEFSGAPLWRHQLHTLEQAGADEILISGRKDACYAGCGFPIIGDEVPDAGPLAGVAALLAAAANPLVMVLAIDMPYMTAAWLGNLREQCTQTTGAVPRKDGFFEGLAAVFPKSAHAIAGEALRGGDHSMQHFVRVCGERGLVKIIDVSGDDALLFHSLNSPADLAGVMS